MKVSDATNRFQSRPSMVRWFLTKAGDGCVFTTRELEEGMHFKRGALGDYCYYSKELQGWYKKIQGKRIFGTPKALAKFIQLLEDNE